MYTELKSLDEIKQAVKEGFKIQFQAIKSGFWYDSSSAAQEDWDDVQKMLNVGHKYRAVGAFPSKTAEDILIETLEETLHEVTGMNFQFDRDHLGGHVSTEIALRAIRKALQKKK